MQYRYKGPAPVVIPEFGLTVQPGDKIDVAGEINHSDFELVEKKSDKADKEG